MPSVTLTKPTKWAWSSGAIETPSDATNLVLCEPFWSENDFSLVDGATHTELTGKTVNVTNSGNTEWTWVAGNDANVGGAINRSVVNFNGQGLDITDAGLTDGTVRSFLWLIKRSGTGDWYGTALNQYDGFSLRFDGSDHVQFFSHFHNAPQATSSGTFPNAEWHCLGMTVNTSTGEVKFFIDGVAAGTGTVSRGWSTKRTFGSYWTATSTGVGFRFGFCAEWSDLKSDAFMIALTANPYRLLAQAGGGATTKTITLDLKSKAGVAQAGLAGLHWAAWEHTTPTAIAAAPLDSGTAEVTDGTGQLVLTLTHANWANGDGALIALMSADGVMLGLYKANVVVA